MRRGFWKIGVLFAVAALLIAPSAILAQSKGEPGRGSGKPNPLKNVYFGEQHLHSQDSPDAYAMGTRNTPDDAFNFCKGLAVKKNTTGKMVQKKTPYDWCALTDHAEYLGVFPQLSDRSFRKGGCTSLQVVGRAGASRRAAVRPHRPRSSSRRFLGLQPGSPLGSRSPVPAFAFPGTTARLNRGATSVPGSRAHSVG